MELRNIWIGLGVCAVLSLGAVLLATQRPAPVVIQNGEKVGEQQFGGTTGLDSLRLKGNLTVDGTSTLTGATTISGDVTLTEASITNLTATTLTATNAGLTTVTSSVVSTTQLRVGALGSILDVVKTVSTTINADNLAAGQSTSSAISVSGAVVGDAFLIGKTGSGWENVATSGVMIYGSITAANVGTIYFENSSSGAVNLTGTVLNGTLISSDTP